MPSMPYNYIPLYRRNLHFGLPAARRCGSIRIKSSTIQSNRKQRRKNYAFAGKCTIVLAFFPTCQVRVVRFYQNCSSPPSSSSFLLLLLLRDLLLFYHLCLHFHVHCCLANSWPSSSPTSELSAHCWTSTWDLPSSVRTAGPQPGTFLAQCAPLDRTAGPQAGHQSGAFRAQCAPLDLNLGPSELSEHRWTSTAR